ncbi:MAG TPA: UDP-N-acetylmuramate dehydrogenase [Solirubrobacteraceae bacterium]|nr:UDP-N-acetylmuramate dehydrogenase [Solirubrobacteraceae bacterium]
MNPTPEAPSIVRRDVPLARFATIRTGGPAEWFARAGDESRLRELLGWARAAGLPVAVVGSGSNLLVADEGVAGLVIKLDRGLATIDLDPPRILCGGGARLPAVAARAAQAGLSGIEFGVNIPGTVGGAVRMNANAYGGELGRVLEWVEIVTATGSERRGPDELGFGYRRSNLGEGEIVARAALRLEPAEAETVKATLAGMRSRRHEAQPQGIKTFGSTFKNPEETGPGREARGITGGDVPESEGGWPESGGGRSDGSGVGRTAGQLLSQAGCNGLAIGGARFAPKHANFVENTGSATTADILALMAEGRRRVLERFGVALEPEVQTLGDVRFPW